MLSTTHAIWFAVALLGLYVLSLAVRAVNSLARIAEAQESQFLIAARKAPRE